MKSDVKGCSQCPAGQESYEYFTRKIGRKPKRLIQYDYRTESGELFSTIAPTLAVARAGRDEWLLKQK